MSVVPLLLDFLPRDASNLVFIVSPGDASLAKDLREIPISTDLNDSDIDLNINKQNSPKIIPLFMQCRCGFVKGFHPTKTSNKEI